MANYVITAAQVKWLGGTPMVMGIAGVAIAAGEVVALNLTTGKVVLADADLTNPVLGIALNNAAADQPIWYAPPGASVRLTTGDSIDVTSEPVFLSQTAGKLMPHTDLIAGVFGGYVVLMGFLYPAGVRQNIQLVIAGSDITYND